MEKVRVKLTINDYVIEETGIIDNETINLSENKTDLKYDIKNNILTRENNEMKQVINFNNSNFSYLLKEISKEICEKINVISLTNKDKQVNIIYQIGEDIFNLNLKYETI